MGDRRTAAAANRSYSNVLRVKGEAKSITRAAWAAADIGHVRPAAGAVRSARNMAIVIHRLFQHSYLSSRDIHSLTIRTMKCFTEWGEYDGVPV